MTEIDTLDKWRDLTWRASDYLKDGDPLLGSILVNFGMALMKDDKIEEAESCYFRACELFKDDEKLVGHLISSKINLSVVYTAQRNFEKVKAVMKEISDIRRLYNLGNDTSAFLEGNALAHTNKAAGNLKGAEETYRSLQDVYFEIPLDQRNIAHYAEVMLNYSGVLIAQNKHELAIDNQLRTILHLEDNKIGDSVTVFRRNINLLYSLYLHKNLEVEAKALKQKYGHRGHIKTS